MPSSSRAMSPRVLIVEDEVILAWDLEDVLREQGYEIAGTAMSVDAALDMLAGKRIDAVILDVNLKGHLSIPLIYELKRRKTPFVVCTAYSELLDAEEDALAGVSVLQKPVHKDILIAELLKLLPHRGEGVRPGSGAAAALTNEITRLFSAD